MTDGMLPDPLLLAELIAARICHDLSGPIGPMAGMLELAREDPEAAGEALALVTETAAALIARIRLLRAAWGGDCGALDVEAIGALVASGLGRKRVTIDLSGLARSGDLSGLARTGDLSGPARTGHGQPPLAPATARLLLNVLMLGTESLPGGGTLACAGELDGDILITITGPRAAWPAGLAACLADPGAAGPMLQDPRSLQVPLIALLASRPGPRLSLLFGAAAGETAPPLLISPRDR